MDTTTTILLIVFITYLILFELDGSTTKDDSGIGLPGTDAAREGE